MSNKKCKNCAETKDASEFYPARQISKKGQVCNYRDSYCKPCRNEYSTERRRNIKRLAVDYLGGACTDCGLKTDKTEVYDFHHIDPSQKDFAISQNSKSFETIKLELDKCVLLCANCHRLRHY